MARPLKQGIDYFPLWEPTRNVRHKLGNIDKKIRYKALRSSSSSFIKKEIVREAVFKKSNNHCAICGSNYELQVDHINSVYSVIYNNFPINKLNTLSNLQLLCKKCNASKLP